MNMNEYVEKSALIRSVCETYPGAMNTFFAKPNDFVNIIEDAPVLTLAAEKHGHWKKIRFFSALFGIFKCSECGYYNEKTHYCPDCGAEMDGDNTHD